MKHYYLDMSKSKSLEYSPKITPRQIVYSNKTTLPSQILFRLKKKNIRPRFIVVESDRVDILDRCLEESGNTFTACESLSTKDIFTLLLERVLFSNRVKLVKFRTYRVHVDKYHYYTVKFFMIVDSRTNVPEAIILQFYPTDHTCYSVLLIFYF